MTTGPEVSAALPGPVLVVDDDRTIRALLRRALEDEGLEVATAADGAEGLRRAMARRPALVILDLSLPYLAGEDLADRVRHLYGGAVPFLVITADGHASEKAARVGARVGLQKPFDLDELLGAVWDGLGRCRE